MSVTRKLTSPLTRPVAIASGATAESDSVVLSGGYKSFTPTFVGDKSIKFDGTDDVITTSADSTLATKTYSFWAKSTDTSTQAVFSHGGQHIGGFLFNSANSPLLYTASSVYQYWEDNSAQDDGNWHHWLVVIVANDITACELYCDGVKQTKTSSANSGLMNAYSTGIQIGAASQQGSYFDGSLDEFAIFNGDQSALADELYNNGQPKNLSSYSTLDHWFRMGEGKLGTNVDGTNNILFQGITESLGSEQVTGFTNGSVYSLDTLVTSGRDITSAIESTGNWGGASSNTVSIVSGQTYKVTFNLTYNSGSDTLRVALVDTASGAATLRSNIYYTNTNGVNVAYLTATATDTSAHLQLGTWHSTDLINFSATDISVKEVNGQFLGNELVTNGGFSADSDWTKETGWAISGGKAAITSSTNQRIYQSVSLDADTVYKLTVEVDSISGGSVRFRFGGTGSASNLAEITTAGTHTFYSKPISSTSSVGFFAASGTTVSLDNVSVREITNVGIINGPRIQADGGTELVTNGSFDGIADGTDPVGNISGWAAYSSVTTREISGEKLKLVTTSSGSGALLGISGLTTGQTYKFTCDFVDVNGVNIASNSGTLWSAFTSNSPAASDGKITMFATISSGTSIGIYFRCNGADGSGGTAYFDNISFKEVTESVPKKTQNLPSAGSAKSMAFDATDEFVDTGFQPDFIHTDATISFWCNMANFSGFQALGCFSSGKQFYVGFNGTAAGFALQATGKSSTDISAHITAGLWHHIALVADGGTATYYVDGVARDTHSYTPAASANPDTNFYIGAIPDGSGGRTYHMEGSVDELAVWNTALDGDAVKAIYNAGQPTPVTTKTGAYDIYRDNLKVYYKMGDATNPAADGTSNLLFDQTNPGVGAELVKADADLYQASTWTFFGNTATFPNGTAARFLRPTSGGSSVGGRTKLSGVSGAALTANLETGCVYKLQFEFLTDDDDAYPRYYDGSSYTDLSSGSGLKVHYFAYSGSTDTRIQASNVSGEKFVQYSGLSVKKLNGHTGTISGATIQTEAPKAIYALPPVANTKSLNFDGTNDHLITQVDATAQPNNESRYYSWWYKSPSGSVSKETVFSHGGESIGMFAFDWSSNRNLLYMASSVLRYWNSNSKSSDNAWHHWVLKIKYNDITGCELWCDGEKQTVNATTNSGSMNTYTSGITIGAGLDNSRYLEGSIDEFSIHEDLDDEAIRALFNRGRPIDISKSQGAYDLSDKALHWWRMGDATSPAADGTNDMIFQGLEAESDELVTNGDFSDGTTGWTEVGDFAISGGSASITSASQYSQLTCQEGTNFLVAGRTYELQADITSSIDNALAYRVSGGAVTAISTSEIVDGKYTAHFTMIQNGHFWFQTTGSYTGLNATVDNVSVKQVRGQYSGPELVKADAYTSGSWQGSNTAEFGSNFAKFTRPSSGGSSSAATSYLGGANTSITSAALTIGATYKISVDVETDDSDVAVRVWDGSAYTIATSGNGTKVLYFVPTHATNPILRTTSSLDATKFIKFSNISIKEVGAVAVMTNMDSSSDIQTDTPY